MLFSSVAFSNENFTVLVKLNINIDVENAIITNPPTGNASQTFCAGATLNSIQVTGSNIKWYAAPSGGSALSNTTVLVNNTSYYASQTVSGVESTSRLHVTVLINPLPVANTPYPLHYCDPNNDGYGIFDLSSSISQIAGSPLPSNVGVRFYDNLADANTGSSSFITGPYTNINSWTQTLYVRVFNTQTGCANITTLQLIVDPTPQPQTPNDYHVCDDNTDGIGVFDLTTVVTPQVLGATINPASCSVTYYSSLANAQAGTSTINPSNVFVTANITIWIRVENNATGCFDIVTVNLIVDSRPQPTLPTSPYTICDSNQDGISSFDLNTLTPDFLIGAPEVYTISYYLTSSDAESGSNSIDLSIPFINSNSPFQQFLWVRAENPVTHCFTEIQVELDVDPAPIMPSNLSSIVLCDNDNNPYDGCTTFNISSRTPIVLAAQSLSASNYVVTYYTSQTDASVNDVYGGMNPIINTSNYYSCGNTTIWVRIENTTTHCFAVGSFHLTAIPRPSDPVITLVGNVLYSNASSGNQWYDQNGAILGAIGTSFTLPSSGLYGCQVQNGDCWSNIVYNNYTLGTESFIESNFSLFPNPTSDLITVLVPTSLLSNSVSYAISDILGKTIFDGELQAESTTINISHLEDGVYFILFKNKEKQIVKKIMKR